MVLYIFFQWSGTPVLSQLVFCKHFCVWRCIPDVSMEKDVLHVHLPLCHLVPPLLKLMSIESVMPFNHLIPCCPLLQPSVFPSFRVFSSESALCIRWPNYRSLATAPVLPMNIQDWFPLGWTGWISLQSKGLSRVLSSTFGKHSSALSFLYGTTLTSIHDYGQNHSFD